MQLGPEKVISLRQARRLAATSSAVSLGPSGERIVTEIPVSFAFLAAASTADLLFANSRFSTFVVGRVGGAASTGAFEEAPEVIRQIRSACELLQRIERRFAA